MHDMLAKLYDLEKWYAPSDLVIPDVTIRKPIGPEKHVVIKWVRSKFFEIWSSEVDVALSNEPKTCFIAVREKKTIGFAAYDATARGFFGPMGVDGSHRGGGIGKALLISSLLDMRNHGYGYAVIGGVGPAEFYRKTVGAVDIPDSDPSVWATWVR
jgi:GNAT superfamily N-acetyltransferase